MFDINNYNIVALFSIIIVFTFLIIVYLRNKISSVLDPLMYEIVWLSSNISFLIVFSFTKGVNPFAVIFLFSFLLYIVLLNKLLISNKTRYYKRVLIHINTKKTFLVYIISVILLIYAKQDVFIYMKENDFLHWFLYRFVDLQGRNPILRIINMGVTPIFLYLSFFYIFLLKKYRIFIFSILLSYTAILVLAGGRSSLLSVLLSFGVFLVIHRNIYGKSTVKKINLYSSFFVFLALLFIIGVSTMYHPDYSYTDGIKIFLNRIVANADGLEYYMLYDGYSHIKSGFFPYILSFLGIYLKGPLGIDYKNIGQQLSELVVGHPLSFAQGANYTLPLQVVVFGYYLYPVYVLASSLIVVKMRNMTESTSLSKNILIFFLISTSFGVVHDLEYFTLKVISFFIVYILFFYPILNINFNIFRKKR